jgi:hypothetical protein
MPADGINQVTAALDQFRPGTVDPPTTGVDATGWSKAESMQHPTAEPPSDFDDELKELRRMAGLDK